MAVRLEMAINRYVGNSRDDKPISTDAETVPVGSTFRETDTGRVYVWNGRDWTDPVPYDANGALLAAMHAELVQVREYLEIIADRLS